MQLVADCPAGIPTWEVTDPVGSHDSTLLGPPQPFCPDGYSFDPTWGSCWPKNVPHKKLPPGSPKPHACKCPPGQAYLVDKKICWGAEQVEPYAGGSSSLAGHDQIPMPYRGATINVSAAFLADMMSYESTVFTKKRVGVRSDSWTHHPECHSQSIAVCGDYLLTSCLTLDGDVSMRTGYLQRYYIEDAYLIEQYQDGLNTAGPFGTPTDGSFNFPIFGPPFPHSAIGHPAVGTSVIDGLGDLNSDFAGRCLVPMVSHSSGTGEQGARIDLLDPLTTEFVFENGSHVKAHDDPHQEGGLSCCTLIDLKLNGQTQLFLIALSNTHVYLYQFIWLPTASAFVRMDLLIEHGVAPDPAGLDENWTNYQSIVAVHGAGDELFVIAGHDDWIDTFKVEINFDGFSIKFTKIAKQKYGAEYFKEGMDVQVFPSGFRIWCLPNDYRRFSCNTFSVWPNVKCTDVSYIDKFWS